LAQVKRRSGTAWLWQRLATWAPGEHVKRQAASVRRQASSVKRQAASIEAPGRARAERPSRQTRAFGAGVGGVKGANARAVGVSSTSCSARRRLWGHGHPERLFGAKIWVRNGQDPSAAMRRTPPEWLPAGAEGVQGLPSWPSGDDVQEAHMCGRARNQHVGSASWSQGLASLTGLTSPTRLTSLTSLTSLTCGRRRVLQHDGWRGIRLGPK
jgi:hypothetical protein